MFIALFTTSLADILSRRWWRKQEQAGLLKSIDFLGTLFAVLVNHWMKFREVLSVGKILKLLQILDIIDDSLGFSYNNISSNRYGLMNECMSCIDACSFLQNSGSFHLIPCVQLKCKMQWSYDCDGNCELYAYGPGLDGEVYVIIRWNSIPPGIELRISYI